VSKDRAAPFSRKHRQYWIPVTGGMLLIGAINVSLGMCSYEAPRDPQRIEVHVPGHTVDAPGTLGASELPAEVMRAFAVKYPRTLPTGATKEHDASGTHYVIGFPPGAPHKTATFRDDGSFETDD
jgi:hypothetical protein